MPSPCSILNSTYKTPEPVIADNDTSWDADELRTRFSLALSDMYRTEVPLYGDLVQIVQDIDDSIMAGQGKDASELPIRHNLERHGAIRLGSEHELRTIKRLFGLLGMHPVGYYDLSVVNFPLHATAFRPVTEESLAKNPFRVFTTVLRKDLISPNIRGIAENILEKRNLFTPRLLEIIEHAETQRTMSARDADDLIAEALKIFKWHSRSTVAIHDYQKLQQEHPMIADIACFPSAHINHLTPRTLDIDRVQQEMVKRGLPAKDKVEGPPPRQCPILLRQTSFKALEERVDFYGGNDSAAAIHGTHTARFGEVEQRGAAVTREGRDLYDQLLSLAGQGSSDAFSSYPDTWSELRKRRLVYFRYQVTPEGQLYADSKPNGTERPHRVSLEQLLSQGLVTYEPITYEDFLPFSAAGIFKSNLAENPAKQPVNKGKNSLAELEAALGCKILNEFDLYEKLQQESVRACEKELHLEAILVE